MNSQRARVINLSAGAVTRLWGTLTNTDDVDITGGELAVALAEGDPVSGDWKTPDDSSYVGTSAARVMLLVGTTFRPAVGSYIYWGRSTNSPEVAPVRLGIVRIT